MAPSHGARSTTIISAGALPRLICYRASVVASEFLLPKGGTMSTISPEARRELVAAAAERYRQSTAVERGRILDEFVALTGYHRKHAIRVLNGDPAMPPARRPVPHPAGSTRHPGHARSLRDPLILLCEQNRKQVLSKIELPAVLEVCRIAYPELECGPYAFTGKTANVIRAIASETGHPELHQHPVRRRPACQAGAVSGQRHPGCADRWQTSLGQCPYAQAHALPTRTFRAWK